MISRRRPGVLPQISSSADWGLMAAPKSLVTWLTACSGPRLARWTPFGLLLRIHERAYVLLFMQTRKSHVENNRGVYRYSEGQHANEVPTLSFFSSCNAYAARLFLWSNGTGPLDLRCREIRPPSPRPIQLESASAFLSRALYSAGRTLSATLKLVGQQRTKHSCWHVPVLFHSATWRLQHRQS